jgi:hypothetical protein
MIANLGSWFSAGVALPVGTTGRVFGVVYQISTVSPRAA